MEPPLRDRKPYYGHRSPRLSLKARVEALFRAHPNEWISSFDLQRVGGAMASRTRISEVRRSGMKITNRCRRIETPTGPQTVSEYRYEPTTPTQARLALGEEHINGFDG